MIPASPTLYDEIRHFLQVPKHTKTMKIKPDEISIPRDNPFHHDLLDRKTTILTPPLKEERKWSQKITPAPLMT